MKGRAISICILLVSLATTGAIVNRTSPQLADEQAIRQMYAEFSAAVKARDLNRVMAVYSRDEHAIFYDAFTPRQYVGYTAYRKDYAEFFKNFPGPASSTITDLHIGVSGPTAYAYGIDKWVITGVDKKPITMVFRFTELLRKEKGKWVTFHEHVSFPVDPVTNKVDYLSKP